MQVRLNKGHVAQIMRDSESERLLKKGTQPFWNITKADIISAHFAVRTFLVDFQNLMTGCQ
jgi:hypothetical protein